MSRTVITLAVGLVMLGAPTAGTAWAHAFGQRYDLPLPLGLYLLGAGTTVAVSFLIISFFVARAPRGLSYPSVAVPGAWLRRTLAHPALLILLRLCSLALFLLILLAGFLGDQEPLNNVVPTLVWVIWWVGLAYVSALIGNLWPAINPWSIAFDMADRLYRRLGGGRELGLGRPYLEELGVWPGIVLFIIFAWLELVWLGSQYPASTATAALLYSLITWAGMFTYGRDTWLRRGEVFSIVFGMFARFAPLRARRTDEGYTWELRPYAAGLLTKDPVEPSLMVFVLVLLSTLAFDGFKDTPFWAGFVERIHGPLYGLFGARAYTLLSTVTLVGFSGLFFGIYFAFAAMIERAGRMGGTARQLAVEHIACHFVLTIVPIAIAYHLAHYFSYLLVIGQYAIPLASDPFGFGWDLFGTVDYRVDINIVGAYTVWYVAVGAIVFGHIVSVYLAHLTAMAVYDEARAARFSQYPMLVLMVGYTVFSLWIFAQPIVEVTGTI